MTQLIAGPLVVHAQSLGVTFAGPIDALDQLDLEVRPGEFLSIVGPSGCGKSTLLRLIAGLIRPSRGALVVCDLAPVEARRNATRMSFVFQDATLLPWRSAAENIALPLELQRLEASHRPATARRGLDLVGLSDFANRYPDQLSGGMRMRVALARALVTQPDLLLMDEPFGALDDISRGLLNEELHNLWAARRWTGIFVTHNIAEAVFLSQRVLVMSPRPGRIVAEIAVPFAIPRQADLRGDADFARLVGQVSGCLQRTL